MGGEDRLEPEPLRGLGAPQASAIDRPGDMIVDPALQGVDHRHGDEGTGPVRQRVEGGIDDRGRNEGAGRVMDEHRLRRKRRDGLQSIQDGFLPAASTRGWFRQIEVADRGAVEVVVVGIDHLYPVDARVANKGPHAVAEQGLSRQPAILFGYFAAKALPAPGGDDKGHATGHESCLSVGLG